VRLAAAVATVIRQPRAAIRAPAWLRKPVSDPGTSRTRPAYHPAGEDERGLQRAARAERERLAAHEQAERGDRGGEQGQATRRRRSARPPAGWPSPAPAGEDRQAQPAKTFQIPDTKGVEHVLSCADAPAR